MSKQHFALRLIPSRPDFAQTMNDQERAIMQQHLGYWKNFMDQGKVIVFGPVLDPAGAYGLGIVAVDSEQELREFMKNDPAATINRYEYHPMMAVVWEGFEPVATASAN
jgi:uncharacterized protein YciI